VVGAAAQTARLAILAVIASAGERGISRQKLYAILWPESDNARARAALNQALYTLRRDLEVESLTTGQADLRLDSATISSDVGDLERAFAAGELERVAQLYKGPFLDGVHPRGAEQFEPWAEEQRRRLQRLATDALERLASGAETSNLPSDAIRWWRELSAIDPLSARNALRLMQSLVRTGDTAAALQFGRDYEARLRRELEIDLPPEIASYVDALRRGSGDGESGRGPVRPTPVAAPQADTQPVITAAPVAVAEIPPENARDAPFVAPAVRRSRRIVFAAASAAALIAAVSLGGGRLVQVLRGNELDSRRVLVAPFESASPDSSLDRLGAMAADWIAQGLARGSQADVIPVPSTAWASPRRNDAARRDPLVLARESAARFVVTGTVVREGDSLRIAPRVMDAVNRDILPLAAIPAGDTSAALALVERAREAVAVAIATRLNTRLSAWSAVASQPSTVDAYAAYADGMEAFAAGNMPAAAGRFGVAARLDTTFAMPLLWSLSANRRMFEDSAARRLIAQLEARRDRLTLWERAFLDYETAEVNWDIVEAFRRAKHLADLAPGSEWRYQAAMAALRANRPRDVLRFTDNLDPDRGWFGGSLDYWVLRIGARHMLPDIDAELRDVASARRLHPDDFRVVYHELGALARAGDARRVNAVLDQVETWTTRMEVFNLTRRAGLEARAHGHRELAEATLRRALQWLDRRPPDARTAERYRRDHAETLYYLGRVNDALAEYRALAATNPRDSLYVNGMLGLLAAGRGDSTESRRLLAWIDNYQGGATMPLVWRARILAAAGDLEGAMRAINLAFERGRQMGMYHWDGLMEPLWSYPPFEEFIAPRG